MSRARSTQGLGRTSAAPSSSLSPMMASTIPEDPGAGEAYDMTELEDAIARACECVAHPGRLRVGAGRGVAWCTVHMTCKSRQAGSHV